MAISNASLKTKIKTEIIALYGAPDDAGRLDQFAEAVAKAVIDELKTNGSILPGTFIAPDGGGAVTGLGQIE